MQSKKRFTETNLWETVWFSSLTPKQKLFWYYINDKCDNIGIWEPNISLVGFYLKIEQAENFVNDFLKSVNTGDDRIIRMDNGNWFLTNFVRFQYVKDKPLNPKNPAHKSYLRQIKESGMTNWFQQNQPGIFIQSELMALGDPSETSKDKDIDKDQEEEKDLEEVKDYDIDIGTVGNGFYNSPVIPDDIDEFEKLDDESVNELDPIFKFTDVAERIINIWPKKEETSGFGEILDCEELVKELVKAGSTVIVAEKTLKNELRSLNRNNPEIDLSEALSLLNKREEARYKTAS